MLQLRPAGAALPPDARILYRNDVEPHWDSCDGMASTYGWDDVVIQVHFSSATTEEAVFSHAAAELAAQRWPEVPLGLVPGVTAKMWSKLLANGTTGKLAITKDNYGTSEWTLFASAPPDGQRVSGC